MPVADTESRAPDARGKTHSYSLYEVVHQMRRRKNPVGIPRDLVLKKSVSIRFSHIPVSSSQLGESVEGGDCW